MCTGVAGQSQDTHGPSDVPINYLAPYVDTIKDPVRRQLAAKLSVLCVKPSLWLFFGFRRKAHAVVLDAQ